MSGFVCVSSKTIHQRMWATLMFARPAVLGLSVCLLSATVPSFAQAPDKPLQISIPAGDLADALDRLGDQSGVQIMYEPALAKGIRVPAVSGTLTVEGALHQLLARTGLKADRVNDKTVVLKSEETKKIPSEQRQDKPTSVNQLDQQSAENLQEIVVTAQKREERLQDVPISISVLSGKELDRSTFSGVAEALGTVPGVAVAPSFMTGGTQVTIRGVSVGNPQFAGSSPTAYYLDSVPFGLVKTGTAPDTSPYDLERLEVLRGPQGTLYGASTLNGVVRVLTHDADLNKFELKVRATGSATDEGGGNFRGDAAVNVPLVEGKLAVRAIVGYENDSGWIDSPVKKDVNDAELRTARLKVNAQPTDDLSLGVSMWRSRNHFGGPSTGEADGKIMSRIDQPIESDFDTYGFNVGYRFSGFSLLSTTSYLDYNNDSVLDFLPFLPFPGSLDTAIRSNIFSQELLLSSRGAGMWRWSAGAIFRHGSDRVFQFSGPGGSWTSGTHYDDTSESYAGFGEVTRLLLDGQIEMTAGLRYFHDDVSQQDQAVPAPYVFSKATSHAATPRAVLTWHPNAGMTVYTSYSEGFRSGFPQDIGVPAGFPAVRPDKLKNYEIGSKGSLADGRVSYDAAVYYMDWVHVQQSLTVQYNGVPVLALVNGNSASGPGFDVGLTLRPVESLTLGVTVSWNRLSLDSDVAEFPAGAPPQGVIVFKKGDRLNYSPEYTAGASAEYQVAFGGSGYQGRFAVSANYTSKQTYRSLFGPAPVLGSGDSLLIGRVAFSVDCGDRWLAALFVNNVTNEKGTQIVVPFNVPDWSPRPRPRTVGMQLDYRF